MSHPFGEEYLLNRRSFLAASTSSLLVASRGWSGSEIVKRNPSFSDHPFTLGVASGDPDETGFVIWTRLAPKPLEGGGMPPDAIAVAWEVAEDEGFSKIIRKGESIALPQLAHSVHVEVEGLQPNRVYWYRFLVGSEVSPIGRSKTMPAFAETPDQLHFAFASCQHYEAGYYTAYEHMAKKDLDLVIHLGDYIYEGGRSKSGVRQHIGGEIVSLSDYRRRYAQYKTDEFLQETHHKFPWIVTWDDHEFDNNYAGEHSQDEGVDPTEYLKRRANAYQAYYEHQPLRHRQLPSGPHCKLYRRIRFGQLAEFNVLDTRQYRTDQPNGDGAKPLTPEVFDPKATMLGDKQEGWLFRGLIESPCRWNVLAQQVMMARVDFAPLFLQAFAMDQWPGYDVDRTRILDFLATRQVSNPIVITGDIHSNWCSDLLVNFDDKKGKPVASEFVTTSITSGGDDFKIPISPETLMAENPFLKFQNNQRGFVECTVNADEWRSDYQVVEYVTKPGAAIGTAASFIVENGVPGVKKA